ncbi:MAG TPA: MerR family transcriptional regulator [Bryobacteraceae bacterium]|nr:MerR family transcriptional regulator [Bryobacteraceae bacterium]
MKTGELARAAGVNLQTIRFYERERLLKAPPRTAAGYRCYTERDLERVIFIKVCQQLGFALKEIQSLAELHDRMTAAAEGGSEERLKIASIAQERLRIVDEKLRQLTAFRAHLQSICDNALPGTAPKCPAARLETAS